MLLNDSKGIGLEGTVLQHIVKLAGLLDPEGKRKEKEKEMSKTRDSSKTPS